MTELRFDPEARAEAGRDPDGEDPCNCYAIILDGFHTVAEHREGSRGTP
jgi:hypothetical protein